MSLGLRSKRIEIPFRLGNLADAVETTQSLGGLTTVAPSIFPGPSRTFQESGQSLPIWRSQRPLHTAIGARSGEKHLSCSRHWRFPEVSQKVLKCFEIRIVFPFFLCFFLCFFDLMQAVHPTHLTSFDKTVTVPRLHPASRIFIGLLLPERCVASTHGIANAIFATRWFGWDECDEYEHTYIHNYTHMYIYITIYIYYMYIHI